MTSLSAQKQPLVDRSMLLPEVILFNIKNNPDQVFYTFAKSDSGQDGTAVISHLEFGKATHRVAHALRPRRSGVDGEVVALVAHTDTILYQTIVAGLIVAGLVPFPISPRNSPEIVVKLLSSTSCRRVLTTRDLLEPLLTGVRCCISNEASLQGVEISEAPTLDIVYPYLTQETLDYSFHFYPPPALRPSVDSTCMIVHSSGSTGTPKPIAQTHLSWIRMVTSPELREYSPPLVMGCMILPPFHIFGLITQLFKPAYELLPVAVYPPHNPAAPVTPSPDNALEHAKLTKANIVVVVPSVLQVWFTSPEAVAFLKTLEFIIFGGGPLPPKVGEQLVSAGVRLVSIYGGTEFGTATRLAPTEGDEKDWLYMKFVEHVKSWEHHRPVINNLDGIDGYATRDLFMRHPTKEHLWKIVGRLDDVIIHSSGEKTVPGPMEAIIASNPLLQGVLVFGRQRDHTGLLVELCPGAEIDVTDPSQVENIRNELWPTVEEANRGVPAFSRIFKDMIIVASKAKPLPRAGKGTVMRKAALEVYAGEIEHMYGPPEAAIRTAGNSQPASWNLPDVKEWILEQVADISSGRRFCPELDLFNQGFDSLSATMLRQRIINSMRQSNVKEVQIASHNLGHNLIYQTPTIIALAIQLVAISTPQELPQAPQGPCMIEALVEQHSAGLRPSNFIPLQQAEMSGAVVLLTGSTGHLGSQILASLLQDNRIRKIYAFNRPTTDDGASILDRHMGKFRDIGLDTSLLEDEKLVFIVGDTSRPDLGIDSLLYKEISREVDVIIHNAWTLNFNLPLGSYEPSIQGTRHLIDLIKAGPNRSSARFLFVSSVAAAQSWDNRGPVPEDILEDASIAMGGGYGEGKHVAERIVGRSGLRATSLRVGQVCGGRPRGAWPVTEWVPILVKSSLAIGAIPDMGGEASWLPADTVAAIVTDLALDARSSPLPPVLNVVHPKPVEHGVIMKSIASAIADVLGRDLDTVPYEQWVSQIEAHAEKATHETLKNVPAVKLLEFFRSQDRASKGKPEFSTKILQRVSKRFADVEQIGDADAKRWVEYWHAVALGFIFLVARSVYGEPSGGGLYPPGLVPLINRANTLLSLGQFNEAARIYSEAIEQSPADYLLYYKRATAYFSLSRHGPALEDFDKVLSLTSGTFDNANLMKARIHTRDGHFDLARESLGAFIKAKGNNDEAKELEENISLGIEMEDKMEKERGAQLWNACVESASAALRSASHSIDIRSVRAECALASGDVDSAVGDLTRLSHLLPPSTTLLTTIFRLSYFLLSPSPAPLNTLKQCLHYDPDSKPCLVLHRLLKSFDRAFTELEELQAKDDHRAIIALIAGPAKGKKGDILNKFDDALREHTDRAQLLPPQLAARQHTPEIPLPDAFKTSLRRQGLVRALCKAYTHTGTRKEMIGKWCEELLSMQGCEEDVDGLVGRGEVLLGKQEWEEAVQVLNKAWEASGQSSRDIHSRLQRAQKLLKQSKQKDYYKVLGVSRDADARTIKKAFRNAAKTAHPDKGGTEDKMAAVNEAYEVLTNPELRQRFDNGDDPNDPMTQQGGHPFSGSGHPFAQFFQQQGGGFPGGSQGGFQFHFQH
ncbi:putative NRPS-like protein biosynthetic cluster [Tephrocybe rancida]|nr:putative NRPS-like protein biosynthetic cluster [Tephrocybe rancida]